MTEPATNPLDASSAAQEPEQNGGSVRLGDWPVESLADDRLGRSPFAQALAEEILVAPVSGGYVMALSGPWGSGKTSILNMTVEALGQRAMVVQFNPWMFSGTEALISPFFLEVAKQLGDGPPLLRTIAEKLATYGRLLSPVAGVFGMAALVDTVTGVADQLASDPSVLEQRAALRNQLSLLDQRLVVVLDDVDRLRPKEVRDIVRLVRLVGDFPNTLYLLAFDRRRVEECLGEGNHDRGRAYLEKIVQVTHDVPVAREPDVTGLVLDGLPSLVGALPTGPFIAGDWQNIFALVVRPLLSTPRDARRYLQSLPMTLRLVGDEVALADLLGLEAVRILRPDMFEALVSVSDALGSTQPAQSGYLSGRDPSTGPVGPLVAVDRELAETICKWLFPAARRYFENMHFGPEWLATWRKQRRVANPAVFRFYLERRLPDGVVPARMIDELLSNLGEPDRLREVLANLSASELTDAITRLTEVVEDIEFDSTRSLDDDPARTALPVFLDLLPRLPVRLSGPFDPGATTTIVRLAHRLIKRIDQEERRAAVVRGVLGDTTVLSARRTLLFAVGHRDHIGTGFIGVDDAEELEGTLREVLISTPPETLAIEPNPVGLAELMVETDAGREALALAAEDDLFMLALLTGSRADAHSWSIGAAAVEAIEMLGWDRLVAYLGKELLLRRIVELREAVLHNFLTADPDQVQVLELASRYAVGWRPDTAMERIMKTRDGAPSDGQPAIGPDTETPSNQDAEEHAASTPPPFRDIPQQEPDNGAD